MTARRTPRALIGRALRRTSSKLDTAQARLLGTATLAERSARLERDRIATEQAERSARERAAAAAAKAKLDAEQAKLARRRDKLVEQESRHGARTHRLAELFERVRAIESTTPPADGTRGGLPPTHHIRQVEHQAIRHGAQALLFDTLSTGAPLEVAVVRSVQALLRAPAGEDPARAFVQALQDSPGFELAGDLGAGLVAAAAGVRGWAWELFGRHDLADVLRLVPVAYFHNGFVIDPRAAARVLASVAAGDVPADLRAEDWLSVARFALAAGAIDEAAAALERGAHAPDVDERFGPRHDWLAEWIERARHAHDEVETPAGAIAFAVLDYKQPDQDLTSRNLGDPVQTLASLGHLARRSGVRFAGDPELVGALEKLRPQVRPDRVVDGDDAEFALYRIDRDATNYYALPDKTWTIAFGWHSRRISGVGYDMPPNPKLRPILLSYHVNVPAMLAPQLLDYLRRYAPVGCRDWNTVALLTAAGVPAFFSGCISTTMDTLFPPNPDARPTGTLFVDTPKQGDGEEFEQIFFDVRVRSLAENLDDAVARVASYRDKYEHVVTSRLHCYLPARSIGAHVEFRPENPADVRFDGLAFIADDEFDAMRQGILHKLDAVLGAIAAGRDEDEVYALWRELCAPEVAAARARLDAAAAAPPAEWRFDLDAVCTLIRDGAVVRERTAAPPDGAEIAVELTLDKNLKQQLDVVLGSIVRHCSRPVRAYILCRDHDESDFDRVGALFPTVSFVWLPTDHVDYGKVRGMLAHVTPATMDRLLLPEVLPDVERIVHLDLDLLVLGDLADLYDTELDGLPIGARSSPQEQHRSGLGSMIRIAERQPSADLAREVIQRTHTRHAFDFTAFNAGVMVLDLAVMRADAFAREILPWVERFGMNGQEVLNAYAGARRKPLDPKWNLVPRLEPLDGARIVHWAGQHKAWGRYYAQGRALWREAEDYVAAIRTQ